MARISDQLQINRLTLTNRYVAEPMLTDTVEPDGYVNERYLKTIDHQAKGGWGMLIAMASMVEPRAQVVRNQLAIYDDTYVPGLYELSQTVKKHGPVAGIQLFHAGALAQPKVLRTREKIPVSAGVVPAFLNPAVNCKELSDSEIEEIIEAFGQAAARAKEAEFDIVEIHACHGSLPHQFLTSRLNKREDEWGKNRLLFLTRVVESVRKHTGLDFPVVVRISVDEHSPTGYTVEDTVKYHVPALEKAGVNAIDCSSGSVDVSPMWLIQPLYFEQGPLIKEAKRVKEVAKVPVGTVGKIMDPKMAERIIEEGSADWVGLGRPAWADPHYPIKALQGRYEDISKCIACDLCTWMYILLHVPARCSVNWEWGMENRVPELSKVEKPKNVLIVGGGVAGLEAARVLAIRGHRVTLCEKKQTLGGQINIASDIPYLYTTDLRQLTDYLSVQVKKLGVKVLLGKEMTSVEAVRLNPDVVIVATGSLPIVRDIPGSSGRPDVMTVDDYLWNRPELGKDVAVLGGVEGAEISVSLARQGKNVTLISDMEGVFHAPYLYNVIRVATLNGYLTEAGVRIFTKASITEIAKQGVRFKDKDGNEQLVKADNVILGFGRRSDERLWTELKGKVPKLFKIGDAVSPRYIFHAVDTANITARFEI